MTQPIDLKDLSTEQLTQHVEACHSHYMYFEAAESGYAAVSAATARKAWHEARAELQSREEPEEGILELAARLRGMGRKE